MSLQGFWAAASQADKSATNYLRNLQGTDYGSQYSFGAGTDQARKKLLGTAADYATGVGAKVGNAVGNVKYALDTPDLKNSLSALSKGAGQALSAGVSLSGGGLAGGLGKKLLVGTAKASGAAAANLATKSSGSTLSKLLSLAGKALPGKITKAVPSGLGKAIGTGAGLLATAAGVNIAPKFLGNKGAPQATPAAQTQQSSGYFGSGSEANAAYDSRIKNARGEISDAYDDLGKTQDEIYAALGGDRERLSSGVRSAVDNLTAALRGDYEAANKGFATERTDIDTQQRGTLGQLAKDTSNRFNAGNQYLGARGASDSSATGMYANAITEDATGQRKDILKQAADYLADVETRAVQAKGYHDNTMNELTTWSESAIKGIQNDFQEMQSNIDKERKNRGNARSKDLDDLDSRNYNKAAAKIQEVQQFRQQKAAELSNYLSGIDAQIREARQNMISKQSVAPRNIDYSTSEDLGNFTQPVGGEYSGTDGTMSPAQLAAMRARNKRLLDNPLTLDDGYNYNLDTINY